MNPLQPIQDLRIRRVPKPVVPLIARDLLWELDEGTGSTVTRALAKQIRADIAAIERIPDRYTINP